MELKDFVSQTLKEVEEAISEASSRRVNEYQINNGESGKGGISFSLAVTSNSSSENDTEKSGRVGIKVVEIENGKLKTNKESLESISRIDFTISVYRRN